MQNYGFIKSYEYGKRKISSRYRKFSGYIRRILNFQYRSNVSDDELKVFFAGKSVALVGNAASLTDKHLGNAIDGCDVVIRCNRAPMPSVESHGLRTDIIATSVEFDESHMVEKGAHYLFWMSPPRNALPRWIVRSKAFFLNSRQSYEALCCQVSRPTTGLMVIDLLSRTECQSVSLFGFDFLKSYSLSGPWRGGSTPHCGEEEERFVRALIVRDSRFSIM